MRRGIVKGLLACTLLFFSLSGFGQERRMGTWRMFLPYGICYAICDAGDKIYSSASKSLFSYEKATGVIQTYDKATGLSDVGIKTILYDRDTKVLAVIYSNSNIDLIFNGTDIYNIPDIKNQSSQGAITINGISFYSGKLYVSSDLGISVIDLAKKEISNSYIIGSTGGQIKVFSTTIDGTNIYACTAEGIKYAPYNSQNLADFNTWTLFNETNGISPTKGSYIQAYNNKIYAVINGTHDDHHYFGDTLFEYNGTSWTKVWHDSANTITSLFVNNNKLYFTKQNNNYTQWGDNGKIDLNDSLAIIPCTNHPRPLGWFEDANGVNWEADEWFGLYRNTATGSEKIIPDGPYTSAVWDVAIYNGNLYVASGGVDDSWIGSGNTDGFFVRKDDKWEVRNLYTDGNLTHYSNLLAAVVAPFKNKAYFASFTGGLVEYDINDRSIQTYDKWNSIIESTRGDTSTYRISAICLDRNNNLWMANEGATQTLKVITADGTWKGFVIPQNFELMKKMIVDQNNQLWAPLRGAGVLVWSYGADMDNPNDDVSRILLSGDGAGGLPDVKVYCVAEDKDGNIWVGTNQGIGIYYCPGSVLTQQGCDATQIKVSLDGYIGYLFGTESVRVITVDAANRKWIGTTNGVWLISADGKTEILKFNTENSPLPSNQITSITIEPETGEVFIGTLGGLVSYQGDAVDTCIDCKEALVYPNPVKHDYTGPIAIKGLVSDAYVKITDISGTLVYQGRANGTQMIWDGNGYNGKRVKSGVYFVFSSNDLGKEKKVAKILLAN